MLNQWNWY